MGKFESQMIVISVYLPLSCVDLPCYLDVKTAVLRPLLSPAGDLIQAFMRPGGCHRAGQCNSASVQPVIFL